MNADDVPRLFITLWAESMGATIFIDGLYTVYILLDRPRPARPSGRPIEMTQFGSK